MAVKSHEHTLATKHIYMLKWYLVLSGRVIFKIRIVLVPLKNKMKKVFQKIFIIEREREANKSKETKKKRKK